MPEALWLGSSHGAPPNVRVMSTKFLFELSGVIVAEKEHPELLVPLALPEELIVSEADSPSVSDPLQDPEIEASEAALL